MDAHKNLLNVHHWLSPDPIKSFILSTTADFHKFAYYAEMSCKLLLATDWDWDYANSDPYDYSVLIGFADHINVELIIELKLRFC